MTKRALKRQVREGAFDAGQFQDDGKIRRLPVERAWSPLAHHNDDREQGYLKTIKSKSPGQDELIAAIDAKNLVMALGPAGTGKTYLAVACAVDALERSSVERIVLTRPAVEAGERLGFLPGDLSEKVDPYMAPVWEALTDILGADQFKRRREKGEIEVAPIAFLRGHGTNAAIRIMKGWRESFDDKYTAPQPATTAPADPILHWYTLNKEAKAAEEALLAKLREALVEKAKDPALNPTGTPFDDTVADLLKALSASTENIAFLGHPGRFAAYEACGLRFGPVLGDSPLRLSTLDPVGALSWQVRMTDLPWVTKEQD